MIAARQPNAETEEASPDKSRPRRMLSEKQVLEIVPVGRTTLYRMEKANRFPKSTYIRTAESGSRMRLSLGSTRSMNSIRTVAGAKGAPVLNRAGGRCPLCCA
jgi:predicted DNA-binding transcriptional regulator AlpA